MSITLKTAVPQLVEEIDEQLFETLRDFLALRKEAPKGKLWNELPADKKQAILLPWRNLRMSLL